MMRACLAVALAASMAGQVRAENLDQAWSIALGVNQGLQAQRAESVAQGLNLAAARSARLPKVQNFTFESFLTASPSFRVNLPSSLGGSAGGQAAGAGLGSGALLGLPSTFPLLGAGQRQLPVSMTLAGVPIFTGGRIARTIDAAGARVGAQRAEEFRTAMNLKLSVAEAYVGVLRSRKSLEVSASNVARLDAFARDVRNRREQGMAIKSDDLAAQVSLANARLTEIQAQTGLAAAESAYNRYLCRPLDAPVSVDELGDQVAPDPALAALADDAHPPSGPDEAMALRSLTGLALRSRPELVGLAEQARAYGAQADATLAGIRPQAAFVMGHAFIGAEQLTPQSYGAATFVVDWTITDGGMSRRKAAAYRQQECASLRRRDDAAADVALEVRTRWLALKQARLRLPVARLAISQAEENVNVVTDRYRQQLSTYTEVLDAENRRVQSLDSYFNALYDASLAAFRLRRAVGTL